MKQPGKSVDYAATLSDLQAGSPMLFLVQYTETNADKGCRLSASAGV